MVIKSVNVPKTGLTREKEDKNNVSPLPLYVEGHPFLEARYNSNLICWVQINP